VDELRLWSSALDGERIAAAARGQPVDERTLLAHFPFDEAQGDEIADRIDSGYRLRLHRGTTDSWSQDDAPAARTTTTPGNPDRTLR
jgi:hypothetical protein